MPRPKRPGAPEPKRRSRNGCWPCKARKVKCDEERPSCKNCQRSGEQCDYRMRLNWEGRKTKRPGFQTMSFGEPSPTASGSATQQQNFPQAQGGMTSEFMVQQLPVTPSDVGGAAAPDPSAEAPRGFDPGLYPAAASVTSAGHAAPAFPPYGLMRSSDLFTPGYGIPPVLAREDAVGRPSVSDPPGLQTDVGSSVMSFQRPTKSPRLSVDDSVFGPLSQAGVLSPMSRAGSSSTAARHQPGLSLASLGSPASSSSPYVEEGHNASRGQSSSSHASPDPRRMSVISLLSGPAGPGTPTSTQPSEPQGAPRPEFQMNQSDYTYYGVDWGFKDLDIGTNDDASATTGSSPMLTRDRKHYFSKEDAGRSDEAEPPVEFGFGNNLELDSGGYYDQPVAINIPKWLEPLPPKLLENPMNLLYFHHFLNHTARVLVPYDDPHANPFRTILPKMAMSNDNLLSLLLAYSASHRARLLQQPEPAMRIALWVQDIFPALRQALGDPGRSVSTANVATAIMLASLEIISPTAFGYSIPWQKHLSLARELIAARPGGMRPTATTPTQEEQVCSFLWSWFAYLDVLGSLSGGPGDAAWSAKWLIDRALDEKDEEGYNEIDCIMGFTTRCVYILARIAELARECDARRIGADQRVSADWAPDDGAAARAAHLEAELRSSLEHRSKPCAHIREKGDPAKWDAAEMAASNEAYHYAGLVHLYRRVLGRPSDHAGVQAAVRRIVSCLRRVRKGGSAEACLIFPMFTAGCDTHDEEDRALVLDRMMTVESSGMTQVRKARRLMQRVWDTGQPWETLLSTEFIG